VKTVSAGGGFPAIFYLLRKARKSGGYRAMYKALRSRNACKTCALGMGGQLGGMVNEAGHFPEVCKKSIQAMAADMQGAIPEGFFTTFDLTRLAGFTPRELEAAGRLTKPLYAGPLDTHYRPLEWSDAIEKIGSKLGSTPPDETFFYVSGRSSNEAGFLIQLLARAYGTNNVNNCSYYCHQASGVGLSSVTGSGTATVVLEDLQTLGRGDVFFLIGANPASNHPRLMTTLAGFKRRGGIVVVVNPLRETGLVRFKVPSKLGSLFLGTRIADVYIQPHIGGDIAFLSGVAKRVLQIGAVDATFVGEHADGWDQFRESLESMSWDAIVHASGVSRVSIEEVGDLYAAAGNGVFAWAMGITHHSNGVENVQTIANLAMMRGMLGRRGAGLLPIRGHSNVQGIGSVGVTPALKRAVLEALDQELGVEAPPSEGLDTMACIVGAAEGRLKVGINLGGNLFGSNPDAAFAAKALQKLDLVAYMSTTLNTGHVVGRGKETIILPVLARDEEPQSTTQESMFNYVRLSDGGPARHEGPRSEVAVITDIGERVDSSGAVDWTMMRQHGTIREAISRIIPGYGAIEHIGDTKREFQIEGRTFHQPRFATKSGRARFHTVGLPELRGGNGHLRLMTVRSEGQFNTVVYEEEDLYRGQDRRDVILMSRSDIARLGLTVDQRVEVVGEAGSMKAIVVREIDITPGNAVMYYPEANVLLPRTVDPSSRTPAFKGAVVSVVPAADSNPSASSEMN
jgi:molybdopterin-dependent oxidoreductase alpha subunit